MSEVTNNMNEMNSISELEQKLVEEFPGKKVLITRTVYDPYTFTPNFGIYLTSDDVLRVNLESLQDKPKETINQIITKLREQNNV